MRVDHVSPATKGDRRLGFSASLATVMSDGREPAKITHELQTMLAQRIHALSAGYEDGSDHHELRHDPALQLAAGVDPEEGHALASPSTLCRLENRVRREDCVQLHGKLIDHFIASQRVPPTEVILDLDATDDPLHGKQVISFMAASSASISSSMRLLSSRSIETATVNARVVEPH